jgi:hypothetical protein
MQYLYSKLASTGAIQAESSISAINVLKNTSLATEGHAASSATVSQSVSQLLQMMSYYMWLMQTYIYNI